MTQADLLRLSLSLVVVVLLILLVAWLARRSGFMRAHSQVIKFIASHPLGNKTSVVVVEVDQKRLVLGVSPHQVNVLHTQPVQDEFQTTLDQAVTAQQQQSSSENNAS
ncbi:MAG TPA: flagellar biosynthetic protein FliO [Paenalcaligenes hominis]|uniref:Flagellar protein n=1 Tax=Paenalcaligenes hominis TaxID=643674 RepID=A0A9D2VGT9_9BURK|nr:flagellar biosynthetic protein FliO [Paenalcaligenes hominis]